MKSKLLLQIYNSNFGLDRSTKVVQLLLQMDVKSYNKKREERSENTTLAIWCTVAAFYRFLGPCFMQVLPKVSDPLLAPVTRCGSSRLRLPVVL